MNSNYLSLLFSMAAFALALTVFFRQPDSAVTDSGPTQTAAEDYSNFQNRNGLPEGSNELAAIKQRISQIEVRLGSSENSPQLTSSNEEHDKSIIPMGANNWTQDDVLRTRSDPEYARSQESKLKNTIIDNNADDIDRIQALSKLVMISMFTENQEIVEDQHLQEILDITDTTIDQNIRVQAWDSLFQTAMLRQGSDLIDPLTELVTQDPNPYLRRKGLQSLRASIYRSLNGDEDQFENLRDVFESIAENDEDSGIRRQASQTLQEFAQFEQAMRNSQSSRTNSDSEASLQLVDPGSAVIGIRSETQ